jgi:hypothetical protein
MDHGSNKKAAGPDMLVSYHDNDHYNSVRDNTQSSKLPPVIKTFTKVYSDTDEGEHDEHEDVYDSTDTTATSTTDVAMDEDEDDEAKKTPRPVRKNASCPCGSGQRYRKCCLSKEAKEVKQTKRGPRLSLRGNNHKKEEIEVNGGFRILKI